jgi:hypothetical protein
MNLHTETNQKPLTDYMPTMKTIKFKCKCKKTIYAQWPFYQWGHLRAGIPYVRFLHKNDKAISRYRCAKCNRAIEPIFEKVIEGKE